MITPVTLMISGGISFLIFSAITAINFASMAKNIGNFNGGGVGAGIGTHIYAGFLTWLSGIVGIGGFIWFLVEKFAP